MTKLVTLNLLRDALKCINEPRKWTREAFFGLIVDEETGDMEGFCYCATGAVYRANDPTKPCEYLTADRVRVDAAFKALAAAIPSSFEIGNGSTEGRVMQYNDDPDTTYTDIVVLFARAIVTLEQEVKAEEEQAFRNERLAARASANAPWDHGIEAAMGGLVKRDRHETIVGEPQDNGSDGRH